MWIFICGPALAIASRHHFVLALRCYIYFYIRLETGILWYFLARYPGLTLFSSYFICRTLTPHVLLPRLHAQFPNFMLLFHLVSNDNRRLAVHRRRYVSKRTIVKTLKVISLSLNTRPMSVCAVLEVDRRCCRGPSAEATLGKELNK